MRATATGPLANDLGMESSDVKNAPRFRDTRLNDRRSFIAAIRVIPVHPMSIGSRDLKKTQCAVPEGAHSQHSELDPSEGQLRKLYTLILLGRRQLDELVE